MIKNPPIQELLVQSWGQKDPLEEEIATRSSILSWEIPWEIPWGRKRFRHDLPAKQQSDTVLSTLTALF